MRVRARKFVGGIALLVLVAVWAFLAMAFAQFVIHAGNGYLEAAYYVIVGLGWVLPAMPLVAWMVRPDKPEKRS